MIATTWEQRDGPSIALLIRVDGRRYMTRLGPVDGAQRFLAAFAEYGVPITEKSRGSD
ncbi:MAG TPA: hypothetical protein VFX16_25405 [Pseudonocardiaceae bacterium]|nr:hypothetical protein [Pseudonocardiaceae bacterium]